MSIPANLAKFGYELGQLKRTPRSGWHRAGVSSPESVAAHSWRVGVLAMIIAHAEGADVEHAAVLGLLHDLPETRVGDIGQVGKNYASTTSPTEVADDQTAGLPLGLGRHIVGLIREHESAKTTNATLESQCSRDADKIECLLQAREYEQAGNQAAGRWVSDMANAVTTQTGRSLAEAASGMDPSEWWEQLTTRLPKVV